MNAKLARKLYENAGKSFSPWYGTGFLTVGAGPGNGRPSRAESRELGESVAERRLERGHGEQPHDHRDEVLPVQPRP